ncbi:glycoside hydrolase family 61 protein [Coprinellus micaceus]|uniref:lytic cellulose monooxygenase (C4-dehydrogenating) n=1 Tax=Coprinellus micaceus TaxID=71717 RepID=A0A4Y7TUW8_COPMI|nr:glycoside hydrolase family 61 protein [Coprinellus micaceus]
MNVISCGSAFVSSDLGHQPLPCSAKSILVTALSLATLVTSHYTFPQLLVDGTPTGEWVNVRRTDNFNSNGPVTDVTSVDFRCYNQVTGATASTARVAAGSKVGFKANQAVYHQSSANIYMAKAPGNVTTWDGSGAVWFRVHEIPAVTDGGKSISFPAQNVETYEFTLPTSLPSGQYLVRVENIAIHGASTFGGAQFYISCAQIEVTGGGNGTPGPLVAIPGVYTGNEPGILLNIYWPVPTNYVTPGPAIWRG